MIEIQPARVLQYLKGDERAIYPVKVGIAPSVTLKSIKWSLNL